MFVLLVAILWWEEAQARGGGRTFPRGCGRVAGIRGPLAAGRRRSLADLIAIRPPVASAGVASSPA